MDNQEKSNVNISIFEPSRSAGTWAILIISPVAAYIGIGYLLMEQYTQTCKLPYLTVYTFLCMFAEKYLLLLLSFIILYFTNALAESKIKGQCAKIFFIGYALLWLLILSGQTVRMNADYILNNRPLTTAHVLFYQIKDLAQNEEVTFFEEPCELIGKREYFFLPQKKKSIFGIQSEVYSYISLNNQKDIIPISSDHFSEIYNILEESGGICDVTCYKNSHIIKAINGIELPNLK